MTVAVYENIRLDANLTGDLPTATYKALDIRDENMAHVTIDYAINGTPHVHRAADSSGDIVQHRDYHYRLLLTMAEYLAIRQIVGKVVYFMPHYRDEADYAAYRETVVLERFEDEVPLVRPTLTYYLASITLRAVEGWTVDA